MVTVSVRVVNVYAPTFWKMNRPFSRFGGMPAAESRRSFRSTKARSATLAVAKLDEHGRSASSSISRSSQSSSPRALEVEIEVKAGAPHREYRSRIL
jgi:hypothetical protein